LKRGEPSESSPKVVRLNLVPPSPRFFLRRHPNFSWPFRTEFSLLAVFRTALAERLKKVRVGPASDPRSEMGPLINKPNVERVNKMVEDAIVAGAKIIVRGGPATEGPLAKGAFYRPTLLEVTDSSLPIVQQ
jgi:acyl-CoA reductase-like NAD-dependent aldehyde dehydrogenase